MENKIANYINIAENKILLDGKEIYSNLSDFHFFIKEAYKHFEIDYSKFYKMDALCKLGIVAASILLNHSHYNEDTAILLANRSSCIDIDKKHQKTITELGYSSPSDFVYTLPNIVIGEISIKYKLRSENSFFIFEKFNPYFMVSYCNELIKSKISTSVLGGWLEVNNNSYNAFLFIVKPEGGIEFTEENLLKKLNIK